MRANIVWANRLHRASAFAVAVMIAAASPLRVMAQQLSGGQAATPVATAVDQTCAKECHKDIVGKPHRHGPSNSDCGACHVLVGEAAKHKFSYIVPKEDLCKRCHLIPHEAHEHAPVRDGKCLECHDPHGSEYPKSLRADPRGALCLKCHNQDFTKYKFIHGPVAGGACTVCHKPHGSDMPKLLAQDAQSLCLTCHAEVMAKAQAGGHMHAALEQGCTKCHDPHASDHKYQLRQSAPGLCLTCHQEKFDQMTAGAKVIHGAVLVEGGCTGCHEPHSSKLASLQRGSQPGMCLNCHDRQLKTAENAPVANMAALLAANPDKHGPIREGACTACHNPHAGKNFRMLTADYPQQFYSAFNLESYQLCFKCHVQDLVLKASARGLTQFRDGDRNLHFLHVNQEKGRTCRACHEVHASKRPSHIREAVPFGSTGWMLEINYMKNADGGTCSPGCHQPKTYTRTVSSPAASLREPVPNTAGAPK